MSHSKISNILDELLAMARPHYTVDLSGRFGRGFSKKTPTTCGHSYLGWEISQTPSAKFEAQLRKTEHYHGFSDQAGE